MMYRCVLVFVVLSFAVVLSYECYVSIFFFFKQKTAYEMRISDWSSDVCSSDLALIGCIPRPGIARGSLKGIAGAVPGVAQYPSGCRFHPRCPEEIGRASCRERVCQYV